jgi:hypothetical protein
MLRRLLVSIRSGQPSDRRISMFVVILDNNDYNALDIYGPFVDEADAQGYIDGWLDHSDLDAWDITAEDFEIREIDYPLRWWEAP